MRKSLLITLLTTVSSFSSFAQVPNFTATDCSSTSRDLYTELNNGKVVVMVWIMPCGTCISGAKAAYDAAQSFATSHPGKVLYWLSDDFGNTSCPTMQAWASTNGIGPNNLSVFSNSGLPIDENNYGGTGMPHVAVIGADKKMYFNELNGSATGIQAAIHWALDPTGINDHNQAGSGLTVFPNPTKDKISITYSLTGNASVDLRIVNSVGATVKHLSVEGKSGANTENISLDGTVAAGTYFLHVQANGVSKVTQFTVSN